MKCCPTTEDGSDLSRVRGSHSIVEPNYFTEVGAQILSEAVGLGQRTE